MKLDIYIHGNPKGFKCLSSANDAQSLFRLYNYKKNVGKEFLIEEIAPYYFYTYLFCNNVYDSNGRPNSYFGITLRFDTYYLSVIKLYTLLDTLCNKWVVGNLLKRDKEYYQYRSSEFPQNVFEGIQNDIVNWISKAINDSELTNLNIKNSGNRIAKLNLIDSTSEKIKQLLEENGSLSISADYPLLIEDEGKTQIQILNQQWTDKWNDLQSKYNSSLSNIQALNGKIQTLSNQLSQAHNNEVLVQGELNRVKSEFNQYKSQNELKRNVLFGLKEEKDALLKLASYIDSLGIESGVSELGGNNEEKRPKPPRKINKIWLFLFIMICAAVMLFLTLFLINKCTAHSTIPISQTLNKDTNYFEENEDLNPNSQNNSLEIIVKDMMNNNVQTMVNNKEYKISICNKDNHQPVPNNIGNWEIDDNNFEINNPNSSSTIIKPITKGDNLKIGFRVRGNEIPIEIELPVVDSDMYI